MEWHQLVAWDHGSMIQARRGHLVPVATVGKFEDVQCIRVSPPIQVDRLLAGASLNCGAKQVVKSDIMIVHHKADLR